MANSSNMTDDGSMEEVLASIRRMIHEQDEKQSERIASDPAIVMATTPVGRNGYKADEDELKTAIIQQEEVEQVESNDNNTLSIGEISQRVESEFGNAFHGVNVDQIMPSLIDGEAEECVSNAFAQLKSVGSSNSVDLKEMTERLLRPMLKEWLDQNLPSLVEKAVADEIARLSGLSK